VALSTTLSAGSRFALPGVCARPPWRRARVPTL